MENLSAQWAIFKFNCNQVMQLLSHKKEFEGITLIINLVIFIVSDLKFMFLVGGFSESPMLHQEIRREFGHLLRIIIPQDVGLTILKGMNTHNRHMLLRALVSEGSCCLFSHHTQRYEYITDTG